MARAPSVRAMLAASTPNAPYFKDPTGREMVEALREVADDGTDLARMRARALVDRYDGWRVWRARCDALQCATLSHYKRKAAGEAPKACHCKSCTKWRAELNALFADKKAQDGAA